MKRLLKYSVWSLAAVSACFAQPVATKVFNPAVVGPGGLSTITFTVTNPSTTVTLTGVTFTDNLTGGLTVASPNGINGFCTGGSAGVANGNSGGTTTSLLNTTLVPNSLCTYNINVRAPNQAGTINNTTGPVQSSAGLGTPGTATLTVQAQVTISKQFGVISLEPGTTTTLTFSLANPNAAPITGVAFSDTLPTGLSVATPSGLTSNCGGLAVTTAGSITVSNVTLAANASCTLTINVRANGLVTGLQTNTSGPVSSDLSPTGGVATASVFAGKPLQISYFPNLNLGDSVIDLTNTGEQSGNVSTICVNAYAFSPDEQMIACCSCPVTTSGLNSLSLRNDLTSNTLTPAVANSVVIKLLATAPAGGNCSSSAATASLATLTNGLAAWGTKLHTLGAALQTTETAFAPANVSAGELARLTSLCSYIQANGSGFGICRTCRLGGQGADSR
jgi:uncharacterized repeat protein (TIGR01451 family)